MYSGVIILLVDDRFFICVLSVCMLHASTVGNRDSSNIYIFMYIQYMSKWTSDKGSNSDRKHALLQFKADDCLEEWSVLTQVGTGSNWHMKRDWRRQMWKWNLSNTTLGFTSSVLCFADTVYSCVQKFYTPRRSWMFNMIIDQNTPVIGTAE